MILTLYRYCYDNRFSGCTILLVYVFGGYQKFTVAHLLFSLLCNMSHAKLKSKPDNSTPKSSPPLTVYYTSVIGLRGNFTDLEAFMLKNNPGIFAHCETNLHGDIQDSDFQLPGYLPIHRKDVGHMHGLGVYVKSNLPIAREIILEDENESDMCLRLTLLHSTVSPNIDKALIL